ncbi:MAG: hypothetical protein KDI36_13025 [Pseudomonadales bacterium]|nr:hypothetical protein [Pseudomonadales bacterium]
MLTDLKHEQATDPEITGGKAANLARLTQLGLPVPPALVITTGIYQQVISQVIKDSPVTLADCAGIRERILQQPLPAALITELTNFHEQLETARRRPVEFAVRSSATAEDLADASFAGQHDTYYYVGPDNLSEMILKCMASLWSDQAFSYRESHGLVHIEVSMAVVVQEMIRSDVSGITFTADPVSGDRTRVVTEASWGMGAAIVDGRVSPDSYVCSRDGNLFQSRIADKQYLVPAVNKADGAGTGRLQPVAESDRRKPCLSNEQLAVVNHWALLAEEHFGAPQDIEWSFQDNEFFMLQSRHITTLGIPEPLPPAGRYVIFKPLVENFTDPLTPLTEDLLVTPFPIIVPIEGRVYLSLSLLRSILPLRMTDEQLARLAYLDPAAADRVKLSPWRLVLMLPGLVYFWLAMTIPYQRTADMPTEFMAGFRTKVRRLVADKSISPPRLFKKLFLSSGFFEPIGHLVLLVNLIAPRYAAALAVLEKLLNRWIPDLRADAAALICSGQEDVYSTNMGREIWQLACTARQHDRVRQLFAETPSENLASSLAQEPEAAAFNAQLNTFLATHGHRCVREFELQAPRWHENPVPVFNMIRNYLNTDIDPEVGARRAEADRLELESEIQQKLMDLPMERATGIRRKIVGRLMYIAKYYSRLRENSRFYHIMTMGAVRQRVLEIEAELLAGNILKCRDDVFFLRWHEIEQLQNRVMTWREAEQLIHERRLLHNQRFKNPPRRVIGFDTDMLSASPTKNDDADQMSGKAASPGVIRGKARVILSPDNDAAIEAGEILVAPFTDPAWTPLFLTAVAAVVEVGSFLSHAGTIAREYGMPCVVDVADATRLIRTGDLLEVDGSSGIITRIRSMAAGPSDTITADSPATEEPQS